MESEIQFKDLQLGNKYWVVNGHWEFKVSAIFEDKIKIFMYGTSQHKWINETDFKKLRVTVK